MNHSQFDLPENEGEQQRHMYEIIIVEDDQVISELIIFNLQNEGYSARGFPEGGALFKDLAEKPKQKVSLFILDVMLPDMDGFEICRRLRMDQRFAAVPIMMLTARGSERDKVKGLTTGADDYLTKPFGMREFLARVQALHRRFQLVTDSTAWQQDKNGLADGSEPGADEQPTRRESSPNRGSRLMISGTGCFKKDRRSI